MNSLSWFIYLTQVADGLREGANSVFAITIIATFVAMAVPFGAWIVDEGGDMFHRVWRRVSRLAVTVAAPLLIASSIIYVLLPSKQTLLLIAGAEIGQRTFQSEEVKSVMNPGLDLLKAWIKSETEKLTVPEKKSQ